MKNIRYTTSSSDIELEQILLLQQSNLSESITLNEKQNEGFVTVRHDFDILKKMNLQQPHIIAKHNDQVVGYALCMTKDFGNDIEVLKPMFQKIDNLIDPETNYIVMGQVCIDKEYRKQGIFKGLYQKMKSSLQQEYALLITEVASNNHRSLQAHYAVGFTDLLVYQSDTVEWHIVSWDWT
ncbi:GNAT family N-acetyltransferase [Aquimarina litoralis]|uniref:GNAT family N-acetyltransferase n=1 Tax=Aquimarina litoralis TaxID=584605 RepID=UPI001C58F6B4|nr:GNAT family N-acetyltransferase [Aquimarina litoralis]MBW1298217.1 GNAT family N-acetyltransferase [Aquimarina litoralis]